MCSFGIKLYFLHKWNSDGGKDGGLYQYNYKGLPYQLVEWNKKDLFEVLKSGDYFITLSREDIFGHTTLEAMANGLPVISSDRVVASKDLIVNGENGFLVDINKEEEIKKALDNANSLNPMKAIRTAKKNTIECSAKRLHDLLRG